MAFAHPCRTQVTNCKYAFKRKNIDHFYCSRPPAPVRSTRPVKKPESGSNAKPPPSRGGKPPSGASAKKPEPTSRFNRAKDDKNASASAKSGSASGATRKAGSDEKKDDKEEKIVEEEKEERRFDPSGYDKDLVEVLGNDILFFIRFLLVHLVFILI